MEQVIKDFLPWFVGGVILVYFVYSSTKVILHCSKEAYKLKMLNCQHELEEKQFKLQKEKDLHSNNITPLKNKIEIDKKFNEKLISLINSYNEDDIKNIKNLIK